MRSVFFLLLSFFIFSSFFFAANIKQEGEKRNNKEMRFISMRSGPSHVASLAPDIRA